MDAQQYLRQLFGTHIQLMPLTKDKLTELPIYQRESFFFQTTEIFGNKIIVIEPKNFEDVSVLQLEKQFFHLKNRFGKIILHLPKVNSYVRKRLIENRINFIVPGTQLFLPDLLIDLNERNLADIARRNPNTLLPSAQFLVIYHIIHRNSGVKLEEISFKDIAQATGYTRMAITKAIDNLKQEEIIKVKGEKEKSIRFTADRSELWYMLENRQLLASPVLKKGFIDEPPRNTFLLKTGGTALAEYSDMNPTRQPTYAIDRKTYYSLRDQTGLEIQEYGTTGLEIWKYDPEKLVSGLPLEAPVVDPLSLYLSLKDDNDERVEMALEQILEKYIW
ncbi:MAG: hypothetical protein QHC79_25520 [Pseudosphingobacterium sp.]|nr:hypothetical protein [Pseudosphingobacterium sp.]